MLFQPNSKSPDWLYGKYLAITEGDCWAWNQATWHSVLLSKLKLIITRVRYLCQLQATAIQHLGYQLHSSLLLFDRSFSYQPNLYTIWLFSLMFGFLRYFTSSCVLFKSVSKLRLASRLPYGTIPHSSARLHEKRLKRTLAIPYTEPMENFWACSRSITRLQNNVCSNTSW